MILPVCSEPKILQPASCFHGLVLLLNMAPLRIFIGGEDWNEIKQWIEIKNVISGYFFPYLSPALTACPVIVNNPTHRRLFT